MRTKTFILSLLTGFLLTAFALPAWAGPIDTTAAEIKKVVGAVKGSPSKAVSKAVRRAHAHYTVARRALKAGKKKAARAHALAARAEVRKVAESLGVKLDALTDAQVAAKAKDNAEFKAVLSSLPAGSKLVTQLPCSSPDYGWGCCWAGGVPCSGTCCYGGQRCGDGQCHSTGGSGGAVSPTTGETEGSN